MQDDDRKIWQAYTKTVKLPSVKKPVASPVPHVLAQKTMQKKKDFQEVTPIALPPVNAEAVKWLGKKRIENLVQFDRRVEKQLRQGELEIDAKLDLHGMTQTEAYPSLARFVAAQVKAGRRNILIITGKGKLGQSVLRNNLPSWLQTLPAAASILALRPAAPKHGGDGAFYLILKRKKD